MRQEEITDCNRIISEWMGEEILVSDTNGLRFVKGFEYPEDLQYHTSWDWLMPVVHRILHATTAPTSGGWPYEYLDLERSRIGNSIEYIYLRVIAYIKWHNSQQL